MIRLFIYVILFICICYLCLSLEYYANNRFARWFITQQLVFCSRYQINCISVIERSIKRFGDVWFPAGTFYVGQLNTNFGKEEEK